MSGELDNTINVRYRDALQIVSDFTEGLNGDNPEYERGQLELLADLFPKQWVACGDRAQEIAADVKGLVAPNPHIEVIRNALQAYGNAPALMHLAELEAEIGNA